MALTDAQAAKARSDLEAYEAQKAEDARQAENDRRAAARLVIEPLSAVVTRAAFATAINDLRPLADQLTAEDASLAQLIRNALVCVDVLTERVERRLSDTEPVPSAETEVPPEPAP